MEFNESDDENQIRVTKIKTIISVGGESDSSFNLSITPPILNESGENEGVENLNKSEVGDSISEHLSSGVESVENDRSLQEIEIENLTTFDDDEIQKISQETKPNSLSSRVESEGGEEDAQDGKCEIAIVSDEIPIKNHSKSSEDSLGNEELFDIFANLDLEDESLTMKMIKSGDRFDLNDKIGNDIRNYEELLEMKEQTIQALTSELDSLKEAASSNPSTLSLGTSTDYKQLHEDFHNKIFEHNKTIESKNELIKQLTENLQETTANKEDLQREVEELKLKLNTLSENLQKPVTIKTPEQEQNADLDQLFNEFEENLSSEQVKMLKDVRNILNGHIQAKIDENNALVDELKVKIEKERELHDQELARLNDLLKNIKCGSSELIELRQEMEAKHQKEMEELRLYFEQKCAELEKSYSEEIFSQHSHKRSDSISSDDQDELQNQQRPGPGGDAPSSHFHRTDFKKRTLQNLTENDLIQLKENLKNLLQLFDKFESDSPADLTELKNEIARSNLFKIELDAFKNEIRNKYYAELEILNQDYENKIDLLNIEHENELKRVKNEYAEDVENLKRILSRHGNKSIGYSSAIQEVHSGDFEINEVIQSYERRLQEQIALARIDIVTALENQIQELASNEDPYKEWPQELLTLREKFTERYQQQINETREEYENEIARLKEEHVKTLNGALERARRRNSKETDQKIHQERDGFKKQANLLRKLLGELLKYFTQCEDEVNNTIVEELVKQAAEKNLTDIEKELNESTSSSKTESSSNAASVKRVHLTPNFKELMNLVENSEENSGEFSSDLRNELEACLDKLKSEANAILTLSMNVTGRKNEVEQLDQTIETNEAKIRLKMSEEIIKQRDIIESLERERSVLESQVVELIERLNVTQSDYEKTQIKITELIENGQREIISEGYGGSKTYPGENGRAILTFNELQEKARVMIPSKNLDSDLAQLLEDLVNVGEKIIEDFKTQRKDFEQQIEHLETQLKSAQKSLETRDQNFKEIVAEKNEAIEKIFFLRDVIRELETQVRIKSETETDLRTLISQLESLISINVPTETATKSLENELKEAVQNLEKEVQTLRLSQELVGTDGALRQLKDQLIEFEAIIERKTKELEEQSSGNSGTTCSSPSEDMSVRDVVRSKTPNDCEVPLQQLARLKEKLIRHARAEDAALKRIRDLEMQVFALKSSNEEVQTEKEILKREISDQLCTISSLQIRLDDQRIRAEHIEKQTNSSLENRIYDLQKEIYELQETLQARNSTLNQQAQLIEELRKKIVEKDEELDESTTSDDEIVITMQKEIEHLRSQNELLQKRFNTGVDIIPNLVENIISDKNTDIEALKTKLENAEKQLETYNSLNLDKSQISTLKSLQNSGVNLSEALSIIEFSDPEQIRRMDCSNVEHFETQPRCLRNETIFEEDVTSEISSIQPIFPNSGRKNSTELNRKVHFETDENFSAIIAEKNAIIQDLNARLTTLTKLESNVNSLREQLEQVTEKYEQELKLNEERLKELQFELVSKKIHAEERENELQLLKDDALRKDTAYLNLAKENKSLKREKDSLNEKLRELHEFEEIISVKNAVITELEEQLQISRNGEEFKRNLDVLTRENASKDEQIVVLKTSNEEQAKNSHFHEMKIAELEVKLERTGREIEMLRNENAEFSERFDEKSEELFKTREKYKTFEDEIEKLQRNERNFNEIIAEKDKVIGQFKRDSEELQRNLAMIQLKMSEHGNLLDLNRKLREEQMKNSELFQEIQMLKAQLLGHGILDREIDEITGKVRQQLDYSAEIDSNLINATGNVEETISALRSKCAELEQKLLELESAQLQDANLIEQLRVQLDSATDNELELEKLVEKYRKKCEKLENETSKTEPTEYKKLPSKETAQLERLNDELTALKNDNLDLKKTKRELEIGLKYTKNLLELKKKEIDVIKRNSSEENGSLNEKLIFKSKEVENCRILIDEMENEIKDLRRKIYETGSTLQITNTPLTDQLMNKIEEINTTVKNDKKTMDLILKLTNDNRNLKQQISKLEDENTINVPFENPMNRANYLFAKCLRVESYRKALIFQKKYLISLMGCCELTVNREKFQRKIRFNALKKFRCVVYSVVAIFRMKFIVRRWHSGAKIAENVNSRYTTRQFLIGHPVSRQQFTKNSRDDDENNDFEVPWSGNSPPCREKSTTQRISTNVALLKAPQMLNKYIERYGKIQENLEMLLNDHYNQPT